MKFTLEVSFPADAEPFRGHFPGAPVLPGVAQVGRAVDEVRARAGVREPLAEVRRLKFRRVVRPDETLRLELEGEGAEWRFGYFAGGEPCSSGELVFDARGAQMQ